MVEPRIVVPVVAGSSPVGHPSVISGSPFVSYPPPVIELHEVTKNRDPTGDRP